MTDLDLYPDDLNDFDIAAAYQLIDADAEASAANNMAYDDLDFDLNDFFGVGDLPEIVPYAPDVLYDSDSDIDSD